MQSNQISTDPGNRNLYGGNLFTLCLCCLWEIWMILQKFAQNCGRRDIFCAHRPQCFLIWVWTSPYWSRCELHHLDSPLPWMVQRDYWLIFYGHNWSNKYENANTEIGWNMQSEYDVHLEEYAGLWTLVMPLWEECAPCGSLGASNMLVVPTCGAAGVQGSGLASVLVLVFT